MASQPATGPLASYLHASLALVRRRAVRPGQPGRAAAQCARLLRLFLRSCISQRACQCSDWRCVVGAEGFAGPLLTAAGTWWPLCHSKGCTGLRTDGTFCYHPLTAEQEHPMGIFSRFLGHTPAP